MMCLRWLLLLLLVALHTIAQAQADSLKRRADQGEEQLLQNIELLAEQQQSEEGDLSNLTESWLYYKSHPLNLNQAGAEELRALHVLNDIQIEHLLRHRDKTGNLITIYELQSIDGFDLETIRRIRPLVYVSDRFNTAVFSWQELWRSGRHETVSRFQRTPEKQAGYHRPDSIRQQRPNSYYLGDPNRWLLRYHFTFNQAVSVALSGEKDAGEEFLKGSQKQGFDFYSGHVAIRNIRFVKCLVLGDYQASFGQGLSLWNGFGFGKSGNPASVKRNAQGIRPYHSFDETRFFRGIAGTVHSGHWEGSALLSYKWIDANLLLSDTSGNGSVEVTGISGLQSGGLHNTNSLMQNKGSIAQLVLGGNAAYNRRSFHLGITAQHMQLSMPLQQGSQLYAAQHFNGRSNSNLGLDYSGVWRNMNFYGEAALSQNGGLALTQAVLFALDPRLSFTAHYRRFDSRYQNLLGSAISENTLPQSESGLYLGLEARLPFQLTLSAFCEQTRFPWLRYGISAPANGSDAYAQLNYTPSRKTDLYLRYRRRRKTENSENTTGYVYVVPYVQENLRFHLGTQITPSLRLKSRIEYVWISRYESKADNGVALMQDLIWKKPGNALGLGLRYAVFDTQSYDSRIYAYENDVLYAYSVPALSGKGHRAYLLLDWDVTRKLQLWLRLAQTVYDDRTVISPGSLNEIAGNRKTELKVQVRYRF